MTSRWELSIIVGTIAAIHLVILLMLYPRVSSQMTLDRDAHASDERAEILRVVQVNRADLLATSASLANLAQLVANSRAETNAARLLRIETCVCPSMPEEAP